MEAVEEAEGLNVINEREKSNTRYHGEIISMSTTN